MILETASISVLVKCLVDAVSALPKLPRRALPFVAIGLGSVVGPALTLDWVAWDWAALRNAVELGAVAGAGAVGVHEGLGKLDKRKLAA